MSVDAKKVTVGKPKVGGSVFKAPLGTALPADATTALNSAFEDAGYISDDGVTNAKTRETGEIKAWGGDTVLKPQTSKTDTFKMTFIEAMNTETLEAVHGSENVEGNLTTGITIKENAKELDHNAWVIEMVLNDNCVKRIVIPDAQVTDLEDVVYKDDEEVGYNATLTAYPYSAWDGDTHREYIKKVTASGTSGS
jgi:hypothetical protein